VREESAAGANLTVEVVDPSGVVLATCHFDGPFPAANAAPVPRECAVPAVRLASGPEYMLRLRARGDALLSAGATIATEGNWDDAVPIPLPSYDPFGALYQVYGLEMAMEDGLPKRDRMQYILDRSDYLVISSNRFYGSLPRNPRRWPMSIAYYRALFSGSLGFELVGDFTSYPAVGSWWLDDQQAEEAFTVYDHPRVLVFRKTAAYEPNTTAAILNRAPLERIERKPAVQVVDPPAPVAPPAAHPPTSGG
jgi:hypothetical protein